MATTNKITPFLWFNGQAEDAANFYVSVFKNSQIGKVLRNGDAVMVLDFTLDGQPFSALNGGPQFTFNEAVSFVVHCDTQEEVDHFWEKLTADGGEESQCGWLKDKFGVSWQIIPEALPRLLTDPNPATAQRAMMAMMQMRKIEITKLIQDSDAVKTAITIETTVQAPVEKVWRLWTEAAHIQNWNNASDDWHTPKAVNDLRVGGNFVFTMAAKDGSFSFDFNGVYDEVVENRRIAYTIADGRKVVVTFDPTAADGVRVVETFEAENIHSLEMQQAGWQAILDNFKKYTDQH